MKQPKLYRPMKLTFWSLRNEVGAGLGVIFDVDTLVDRVAMRVLCEDGWKWQIKNISKIYEWDYCVDIDQDVLNEYGMHENFEISGNKIELIVR